MPEVLADFAFTIVTLAVVVTLIIASRMPEGNTTPLERKKKK